MSAEIPEHDEDIMKPQPPVVHGKGPRRGEWKRFSGEKAQKNRLRVR
jgi:hypothetical protein